jgi:hypothetical protein
MCVVMSRKKINQEFEPICVDCWKRQSKSETSDYQDAIDVAMQNADIYIEKNGKKHEDTIRRALMESITRQAMRTSGGENGFIQDNIIPKRVLSGEASYDQMIESVVNNYKYLPSIEIARLTHVGDASGYEKVDRYIDDLHIGSDIDGEDSKDDSARYKVRHMRENSMVLERKIPKYRYLGGKAVVIACHSMLLDISNKSLNRELRLEGRKLLDANRAGNGHDYHGDKKRRVDSHMKDILEDVFWRKEDEASQDNSLGSVPLTTIYYAIYRSDTMVQSVLRGSAQSVDALLSALDPRR